jgi:chitin disaccharide deacetylase
MPSRLIINADDLGVNPQRTHGILQCWEFGVVTSVSIFATMADSEDAAKRAREKGVSAGLHLNLTDEYPLSKKEDIASLVDANGRFFEASKFFQLLDEDAIKTEHLDREIRAQLEWMFDIYGQPTHVNGHIGVNLRPLVIDTLVPIMERYGIRCTRITFEEPLPPFGYDVPPEQLERVHRINVIAAKARNIYAAHGIVSTDHFRGQCLDGNASLKNLRHTLSRLPEGTTELRVHPGSQTAYGTPFDLDPQRQTELRMLLDETIPALIKEKKIELINWADL